MLKREAKKFVVDRGRSKYSPSVCQVLTVLIGAVRIGGEKELNKIQIDDRLCMSKLNRIARVAQLTVRATQYALDKLEADGLITIHREDVRHTYSVHLTKEFQELPYFKEKSMQAAAATKEARKERQQRYESKLITSAEKLRDFNETIRTEVDTRIPEEIRAAQLPARHILAGPSNTNYAQMENPVPPLSPEMESKWQRFWNALDAKSAIAVA
jgi:hypothetical protein